jgi:cystathionine beta-lyase/cystathionine gamma-synthase
LGLSGRGDVLLGTVFVRPPTESERRGDCENGPLQWSRQIKKWRILHGASPSPFSCWMISRCLETFPIQMERVSNSAQKVAEFLEKVPCVSRVLYAGLPSHPTHQQAKKLLSSKGSGVVYFHLPVNSSSGHHARRARNASLLLHMSAFFGHGAIWIDLTAVISALRANVHVGNTVLGIGSQNCEEL